MDKRNVAISRFNAKVFSIVSMGPGATIEIKEPDGKLTLIDIDDEDFIVLFSVTEKEINMFVNSMLLK